MNLIPKFFLSSGIGFSLIFLGLLFSCNKDEVIEITDPENGAIQRPLSPLSSPYISKVFEYTPAPGQYINDFGTESFDENISPKEAADWALNRLTNRNFVSLGSFGGYITVGFDHSVINTGDYDIGVFGNAFMSVNGGSNEPGIVYVMKDTNGNGLPDDIWYELRGSDTFAEGTIPEYSVTYFRPKEAAEPVTWEDNLGNKGQIDYLGAFHSQSTYYPLWIEGDQSTLSGTCLEARTFQNPETGNWENHPFEWGYADNMGEDNIAYEGINNCNRFKISDAIDENGIPVHLEFIDFVKIQTGVSSTAGWLGEVSTEILGVIDMNL